jgi:hypothetical protein
MPITNLMPLPKQQFLSALGTPLVGGKVYTYAAGTSNPKATYTDAAGTINQPNPIPLNVRGEPASPIYWSGNYRVEVHDLLDNVVYTVDNFNTDPGGLLRLLTSIGSSLIGFVQAGVGAVVTTAQEQLQEIVSLKNFGVIGDGSDETEKFQQAINASVGKTLRAECGKTYLLRDTITIPSNVTLDMQGAAITDGVQGFWPESNAGRAKPLFFLYGVENVSIKNLIYSATADRSTLADDGIPTVIFWVGDNRGGTDATRGISLQNIKASNCAASTMFIAVLGNAFDVDVQKVEITGSCSYGINIEYGRAPTLSDPYGMHPYDVRVENFNGYDNPTSVGFLRVASCYNIKFTNCYGKDVRFFIYAWAGDRGISRVSENVVFENCSHYASSDFLPGVVNYVVQVMAADQDGSTGVPLPSWTNYDHLFMFRGCQFQNNKVQFSAALRYYGTQGSTVFDTCIFQGSYYGARIERTAKVTYTPISVLSFRECVFKKNYQDITMAGIVGVLFDHCKFKEPDGAVAPFAMTSSAYYNKVLNCHFSGLPTDIAWLTIGGSCDDNEISGCVFEDSGGAGSVPPLELSSRTFGLGNSNRYSAQGLAKSGSAYYGVQGEPSTLEFDLAGLVGTSVDCKKRTSYVAGTSAVNVTISSITNGNVGDVVVFRSTSTGATVTFVDNDAAAGTSNRILTPATGNLVKTGSRWAVTAYRTATGWVLS